MNESIPAYIAAYLVAVRDAIKAVPTTAGGAYVVEVRFGIEGEDLPYRLVPDDFEDFDIQIAEAQQ